MNGLQNVQSADAQGSAKEYEKTGVNLFSQTIVYYNYQYCVIVYGYLYILVYYSTVKRHGS